MKLTRTETKIIDIPLNSEVILEMAGGRRIAAKYVHLWVDRVAVLFYPNMLMPLYLRLEDGALLEACSVDRYGYRNANKHTSFAGVDFEATHRWQKVRSYGSHLPTFLKGLNNG